MVASQTAFAPGGGLPGGRRWSVPLDGAGLRTADGTLSGAGRRIAIPACRRLTAQVRKVKCLTRSSTGAGNEGASRMQMLQRRIPQSSSSGTALRGAALT